MMMRFLVGCKHGLDLALIWRWCKIELLRLALADAHRLPAFPRPVLRQKYKLAHMISVVCELPVNRLDDGMRFTPYRDGSAEITRV